jgi:O-antigen/teichoic acid export membrane protein
MKRVVSLVKRVGSRRAVKHVSWMMGAQGVNLGIQAAYFVLLARLLGAYQYGIFSGAFALINTLAPYAVLGSGMLFMRYVTENPKKARTYWGNAVAISFTVGLVIAGSLYFIGPRFAKVGNGWLFLLLALGYCLFSQIITVGATVFQTLGKLEFTAILTTAGNAIRLVILVVMVLLLKHATAVQWAIGSLLAAVIGFGWTILAVRKEIGTMRPEWAILCKRFGEGIGFSFAGTTQAIYNDIDKMVLSRDGYILQNGSYSLAYRVVDFATSPLAAVDTVVLPKFFALSVNGIRKTLPLLYRSILSTGGIGILIGLGIIVLSPIIPHIVGKDYAAVSAALIWLSPLPFLRTLHRLTGGVLTASGHQNLRTATQLAVALLNGVLNVLFIPGRGWIAAAWVSLISDGLLALLTVAVLVVLLRRQENQLNEPTP